MSEYQLRKCELTLLHLTGFDLTHGYYQDDVDTAIKNNPVLWQRILNLNTVI